MKRYFYTDPLAAAWMAENHGLRFTDRNGARIHPLRDCYSVKWYFDETPGGAKSAAYFGEIYFIHPDSLNLLEPKALDLVVWDTGSGQAHAYVIDPQDQPVGRTRLEAGRAADTCDLRIIQRDGKPFHWPESEEA